MPARPSDNLDKLPPHSDEAERCILGCILLDNGRMGVALERLAGQPTAFYDMRHREVWLTMVTLSREPTPIDVVTVANELRSRKLLDQVGGMAWLAGLPDQVPGPDNLPAYLEIVWQKFVARQLVAHAVETAQSVMEVDGLNETLVGRTERQFAEWKALSERGIMQPSRLTAPVDFDEGFFEHWFKRKTDTYGWEMHVPLADLRIRPHEMTCFTAENGAGKSTHLGQIAISLGCQGIKTCIASMEVPPATTLWVLSRQLMAARERHLLETDENRQVLARALGWLQKRIRFYNFLGIANWRDVLDTFRYARDKMGWEVFVLDSVLKIGIPDDDYAQQTAAANAFSDFAMQTGAHVFLVVHQNKSDGSTKKRVRGAGAWTDAAHVILSVRRNEAKSEKVEEEERDMKAWYRGLEDPRVTQEYRELAEAGLLKNRKALAELSQDWDSEIRLHKQRWPGAQWQNASRRIFFDRESMQFRARWDDPVTDYIGSARNEREAG